jgi:PAS domain-containing protein
LFDQSHQPIAVVDPESGYFIDANRAAAKIFGYSSPQEIIGAAGAFARLAARSSILLISFARLSSKADGMTILS